MCPNTPLIVLNKGVLSKDKKGLKFVVEPNPDFDFSVLTGNPDIITKTQVYSSMINRYFDPSQYKETGWMYFIGIAADIFDL